MLCNNFPIGLQATLQPQNKAFSLQERPRAAQNDLRGCRDQVYHFHHQKLPLYAQSREPFHTGHGRPFWTNTQTALGGLKMTSEAPVPGLSFSVSKVTPVCPKQGAIPYRAAIPDKHANGLGRPQNDLGGSGTRPIIFSIKRYPCMPKAGSHSIQGMAGHSRQTRKRPWAASK